MSEEATRNDEVAAATVAASETLGEKDEAQATRIDRAQSGADDDEHDDEDRASDASSGQSAGETTDSATPQAAGEEAGGEESSRSSAADAAVAPASPPSPSTSAEAAVTEAVSGEDELTAPLGESDNDDDDGNVASNKKRAIKKKSSSRYEPLPPFVDDPAKVTLRFIFPNKDGLAVTVDCKPTDTVGEVKGMLLSMWPDELEPCSGGNRLRLICMGKGILMPDTRSIQDCSVPVFQTHATPINVAVTPEHIVPGGTSATTKVSKGSRAGGTGGASGVGSSARRADGTTTTASTGCGCVIQ